MKTLEQATIDKSEWGDGPWQNEPDKKQWLDNETGYPCLIVRADSGALGGYVGLQESHPLFKKHYDEIDVEVHGDLTFSNFISEPIFYIPGEDENDKVWWIGFDCAHCFDVSPGKDTLISALGLPLMRDLMREYSEDITYKDFAYVTSEINKLAMKLKERENEILNC